MTQDSPQYCGVNNHRKFTAYLSEVAGHAEEALDKLTGGRYPEKDLERLTELASPTTDRMWEVKSPYEEGYLPKNVQEGIESVKHELESENRVDNLDQVFNMAAIRDQLLEEIEKYD